MLGAAFEKDAKTTIQRKTFDCALFDAARFFGRGFGKKPTARFRSTARHTVQSASRLGPRAIRDRSAPVRARTFFRTSIPEARGELLERVLGKAVFHAAGFLRGDLGAHAGLQEHAFEEPVTLEDRARDLPALRSQALL